MFQYDYADYSIFFLIYWDALEDYMSYNDTNMFNLDYEDICMDLIRDDLNEKYDFDEYDDLDEERRKRYEERHKKRENWNDEKTAGYYSYNFLWRFKTYNEAKRFISNDLKRKGYS